MDNYNSLTNTLKSYSAINSKIEHINKILSQLRKDRLVLEENSIAEINRLQFQNKKMKIDNAHYFLGQSKQSPSLTMGLIETIGEEVIGKAQTTALLSKIKEYRDENVKRTPSLKIKIKKSRHSKKGVKDSNSQSLKRKIK
jgi:hypothetical protein